MSFYQITVTRLVPVTETIKIDVEADDDDEALDLAYETASSFPTDMNLLVDRCTITDREYDYEGLKVDAIDLVEHP